MANVQRASPLPPADVAALVQHAMPGDTHGPGRFPDGARVAYGSLAEFADIAQRAGLMDNIKVMVADRDVFIVGVSSACIPHTMPSSLASSHSLARPPPQANVPRTSYRGVVTAWLGGCVLLHLAPSAAFAPQLEALALGQGQG